MPRHDKKNSKLSSMKSYHSNSSTQHVHFLYKKLNYPTHPPNLLQLNLIQSTSILNSIPFPLRQSILCITFNNLTVQLLRPTSGTIPPIRHPRKRRHPFLQHTMQVMLLLRTLVFASHPHGRDGHRGCHGS